MGLQTYFSFDEGNLLCRLLFSYLLYSFLLDHKAIKKFTEAQKVIKWILTALLPFILTFLFSASWKVAAILGLARLVGEFIEYQFYKKESEYKLIKFLLAQLAYLILILLLWGYHIHKMPRLMELVSSLIHNYRIGVIILGYSLCVWPSSILIKHFLQRVMKVEANNGNERIEAGGYIGQFERIIIFTFVLLTQYAAIGFLITGKSIVRFASDDKEQKVSSEYILVGTMLSYALAIITGVIFNWILSIK